jgi:hypothetical protein
VFYELLVRTDNDNDIYEHVEEDESAEVNLLTRRTASRRAERHALAVLCWVHLALTTHGGVIKVTFMRDTKGLLMSIGLLQGMAPVSWYSV